MNHYVKCNVGINKGLIYTVPTLKRALNLQKTIARRFGEVKDGDYTSDYGNDNDGFVEQHLNNPNVRWMSGKPQDRGGIEVQRFLVTLNEGREALKKIGDYADKYMYIYGLHGKMNKKALDALYRETRDNDPSYIKLHSKEK